MIRRQPTRCIQPRRWGPLRAEIERVLADGSWHETTVLYYQVGRFVDPRIAIRAWVREYERSMKQWRPDREREPASRVLVRCEQRALEIGRRRVCWDVLRQLWHAGRVEVLVWNGRRRVRLAPPQAQGA